MNVNNLEIEKKYLISKNDLPKNLNKYKHFTIIQGFICFDPVIRVRKCGKDYYTTLKYSVDKSDLVRVEHEVKINKKTYDELIKKTSGVIIKKERYFIPYKKYIIELDVFKDKYKGLYYAEVEFKNKKEAESFIAPSWFTKEVTGVKKYNNASLARGVKLSDLI